MLNRIAKFLFGDKRPVRYELEHPSLGPLAYSVDDEAWLSNPDVTGTNFRFIIAASHPTESRILEPDAQLLESAVAMLEMTPGVLERVRAYLERQISENKLEDLRREINALQVDSICLLWPDYPDRAQVNFRGGNADRLWRCGLISGEPAGQLAFDD